MAVPVVELTEKVLAKVRFDRQLVQDDKGHISTQVTPATVKVWEVKDSKKEGFYIRVSVGAIGWYVRKRMAGRGQLQRCMGNWPDLSAEMARKRASIWLGMMQDGIDPLQEKKQRIREGKLAQLRDNRTLAVVFQEYISKKTAKAKSSTTKDREKVVKWMDGSPIWHMSIFDIDDQAVEDSLGPLRDVALKGDPKPAWGPNSISSATVNKIFIYLSAAYMREALQHRIVLSKQDGPFVRWRSDQAIPKPKPRETFLQVEKESGKNWLKGLVELHTKANDSKIFINRADPRSQDLKPHVGVLVDFFLCALLWGSRKEETAKLKWENIDFDGRLVVFPESVTKSGKAGAAPLTPWAVDILKARKYTNELWRPDASNGWVFPSRRHGQAISNPRGIAEALAEETGLMITPHDLRRTLATDLNKSPVKLADVGKLLLAGAALNHSRGRTGGQVSAVTLDYIQQQVEALRPSFQARENHLRRIIGLPILASAETEEAVHADGTIEAIVSRAKRDPEIKRLLMEALLSS